MNCLIVLFVVFLCLLVFCALPLFYASCLMVNVFFLTESLLKGRVLLLCRIFRGLQPLIINQPSLDKLYHNSQLFCHFIIILLLTSRNRIYKLRHLASALLSSRLVILRMNFGFFAVKKALINSLQTSGWKSFSHNNKKFN